MTGILHGEESGYTKPFYSDQEDYCKIIDLKKPSLVFGFNKETAPLFDDVDGSKLICAFIKDVSYDKDVIRIKYKKCEYKIEKDPVTGDLLPFTYTDIASYYYDISAKDYKILDYVKE